MSDDIFSIICDPNPLLRMPTKEVASFDVATQEAIDKMIRTMRKNNGVGLAAPQVGLLNKIIVLECETKKDSENNEEDEDLDFPLTIVLNPKIKSSSKQQCQIIEGCLSFPGLRAGVKRPKEIIVSGLDRWGKKQEIKASGFFCRVLQHEIDHLNGILMVDHIKPVRTMMVSSMDLGVPALKIIAKNPIFEPLGLISAKDHDKNTLNQFNIVKEAKDLGLPVNFWKNDKQVMELLKAKKPDLLIVAGFGKILPKEILEFPKYGVLNIHPSLLPKYRGPSPIQQTILNGDKEAGVSIMKLNEKIDEGDLLGQMAVKLSGYEDQTVLRNAMASLGSELLADLLPYYLTGELKPYSQHTEGVSYSKLVKKEDGLILESDTPETIDRKVRAYYGWPTAYTFIGEKRVQITRARLDDKGKLIIDKVKPEGKKEMTYSEFKRGYKGELKNLKGKLSDI